MIYMNETGVFMCVQVCLDVYLDETGVFGFKYQGYYITKKTRVFGCGFDWKYGKIKVCVDDEFVDIEYMCLEI